MLRSCASLPLRHVLCRSSRGAGREPLAAGLLLDLRLAGLAGLGLCGLLARLLLGRLLPAGLLLRGCVLGGRWRGSLEGRARLGAGTRLVTAGLLGGGGLLLAGLLHRLGRGLAWLG